jgi:hypothetical protein
MGFAHHGPAPFAADGPCLTEHRSLFRSRPFPSGSAGCVRTGLLPLRCGARVAARSRALPVSAAVGSCTTFFIDLAGVRFYQADSERGRCVADRFVAVAREGSGTRPI